MTKTNPLISVVIQAYNHEKNIAEAIESVLAQTFKDIELVIVNDGSGDRTQEIIQRFKDPRISGIYQENQGTSIAANNGILKARGKYIAILAGDDVCYSNRLERQLERCRELKGHIIFSDFDFIGEDSQILPREHGFMNPFRNANRTREEILNYFFSYGNYINASSTFAERKVFLDVGLYNPLYLQLQDFDMWIRLLLRRNQISIIQEKLVKYRIRRDNLNLSGDSPDMWRRLGFEYSRVLRNFLEIGSVEELLKIFPSAEKYGTVSKDCIPYFIARLAIDNDTRSAIYPVHQYFGISVLFDLLSDKEYAERLNREYGFTFTHFYELLGKYDLFGVEARNSDSKIKKDAQQPKKDKK